MQYILNQEEYDEYIELKRNSNNWYVKLSDKSQRLYDYYKENPWSTYKEIANKFWTYPSSIYNRTKRLIKWWYLIKKSDGKIEVKSDYIN